MSFPEIEPPANPQNLQELAAYIDYWAADIYVRDQVAGQWGSYSLKELPKEQAATHIQRFLEAFFVPHRIMTNEQQPKENDDSQKTSSGPIEPVQAGGQGV